MPNWCSTTYMCVGDLKEVRSLHESLECINKRKDTILKNGFGKWWLGNLVHLLGGDWEKYRCRGEITDYSLDGNALTIRQETAWCEQEGVRQIIQEKFPSIKVYFIEEEPGLEVFCTNDTSGEFFPERFLLDTHNDCEYFETIEQAARYVSDIVGHEVGASVDVVMSALDDYEEKHFASDPDIFYSFHEFTVVDE